MIIESEKLNIYEAESFYYLLLKEKSKNEDIILDFFKVDKIDMINIQTLLSLKKSCIQNNYKLTLINLNESLLNAFKVSGTKKILDIK